MEVSSQLLQLADLLRVSAETARDLASIGRFDVGEIHSIASEIDGLAERLDRTASRQAKPLPDADWLALM